MAHDSPPRFRVHHSLRIKGFVKVENLAELAGLPEDEVLSHLQAMQEEGQTNYRESRGLWQLTPDGREAHVIALEEDVCRPGFREGLSAKYHRFLEMNEIFKGLCADWQLRNGETNDHADKAYDDGLHQAARRARRRGPADLSFLCRGRQAVRRLRGAIDRQPQGTRSRRPADVHRRDVRLVPRRVDGVARGPAADTGHRPRRRRQLLAVVLRAWSRPGIDRVLR